MEVGELKARSRSQEDVYVKSCDGVCDGVFLLRDGVCDGVLLEWHLQTVV